MSESGPQAAHATVAARLVEEPVDCVAYNRAASTAVGGAAASARTIGEEANYDRAR